VHSSSPSAADRSGTRSPSAAPWRAVGSDRARSSLPPSWRTPPSSWYFHNHPSGDPSPSPEDVDFSRKLDAAAELLGFAVTDFLVLGEPPFYCSIRRGGSILRSTAPRLPTRGRRRPKYRHPDEPALTWAGTGFIPVWLREEIESGASLAEFLVDGARVTAAAPRQEREIRERSGDHPARTK